MKCYVLKAMYEYMYDSGIALKVSIVIDQAVVKNSQKWTDRSCSW